MKQIVMMANNVEMIKLFLHKLPTSFFHRFKLDLFVDTRITDYKLIYNIVHNYSHNYSHNHETANNISVIDGVRIMNYYKQRHNIDNELLNKYYFSMRFMILWEYLAMNRLHDILMIDDDVLILNNNIEKLFDKDNFAMTDGFCRLDYRNEIQQGIFLNFCKIFDCNLSLNEYNLININSGIAHVVYNKTIYDYIYKFFTNEFFINEFEKMKDEKDIGVWKRSKLYFMDQYFVNFLFRKNTGEVYFNNKEIRMRLLQSKFKYFNQNSLKIKPDIIHYCCSSQDKMKYVDWLDKNI